MEILNNTKAKRRSQGIAFGIFRLLSLCIVLILFAILGFIIYKGIGYVLILALVIAVIAEFIPFHKTLKVAVVKTGDDMV